MEWNVVAVAIKALSYATLLVAGGGVLFMAIFAAQLNAIERRRVMQFTRAIAVAALFVTIVRVMVLSGMLGDDIAAMWDWSIISMVLQGSEGNAAGVRLIGLIAIAAFSFGTSLTQAVAGLGALAIAVSFGLTGHSGSVGPGAIPRVLVAIHVLAVTYWIGALAPLYSIAAADDRARAAAILTRFGNIAAVVVGTLIVAGAVTLWILLGSLEAILTSDYGRLFILKLALVGALLILAALNKFRLTPAIAAGDVNAALALRRSIAGEMLLASAILIVTAVFTTVVGPPTME